MQKINFEELKIFLDEQVDKYNQPFFIEDDPIQIPHLFEHKMDVEIAGFLTATIAWGRREMIIKSATKMMQAMDNSPADFVLNHSQKDLKQLEGFVHRTFNSQDLTYFITTLKRIYEEEGGLENVFKNGLDVERDINMKNAISHFNNVFFKGQLDKFRTKKHIGNPGKGSAAKRMVMYLRWMVRNDNRKVDFGIWNSIPMSHLSCPLDVHTGNVGRMLGFIERKQNDWKTVEELDNAFKKIDPVDPSKYDFALFGLGAMEGWQ